MNKFYLFLVSLFLIINGVNAQGIGKCPAHILNTRFVKSKTYILLTNNEQFNTNLINGFEENWTLTEFEFVESLENMSLTDTSISYLIPYEINVSDGYGTSNNYPRIGLFVGGKETLENRNGASIIFDFFGRERFIEEAGYRAYGIAKILQDIIDVKMTCESQAAYPAESIFKFYHNNRGTINGKTLLVDEAFLVEGEYSGGSVNKKTMDEATFKGLYKGKVKFVSKDELEEAINSKDANYCYFLPLYYHAKYLFIIDCETGSICYQDHDQGGKFISSKDIKEMAKFVERSTKY